MIVLRHIVAWSVLAGEPRGEAEAAFEEATAAYEAERWQQAAAAFARAYEHDPQPKYLYARAQALRFAGASEEAIGVYEAYIAASESEEADAYARDAIELCKDEVVDAPSKPPPPEAAVVTPPPSPAAPTDRPETETERKWFRDPIGHGLFWPGLAAAATGAALVAVAHDRAGTADEAASEARYRDALDRASALRVGGIATLAVGGVLLVAGTIRFAVVASRGRRGTAARATPLVVRF